MNFHIVTLFPESFDSYMNSSIIGRAIRNGKIKIKFYNPRDFVKPTKTQKSRNKPYLRVDMPPYGGGAGMVMQALPVVKAVEKAIKNFSRKPKAKSLIIWLSPGGKQFDTELSKKTAGKYTDVIFVCGRYEGIDERAYKMIKEKKEIKTEKLSAGPYVLTGGELPAMILMDCISRQVEGVLGNFDSREEERASSHEVYTRPGVLEYKNKKYKVPKILLSGNHKKIDDWKNKKKIL